MERVDTISDVRTKELPTGVTLYLLKDSDGKEYSTRNRDLARVANDAQTSGQHVHLDYDEKKNDRGFTNRYLNAIRPVGDDIPMTTVGQAMRAAQAAQDDRPLDLFADSEPPPSGTSDKDLNIAKAVALKAGVEILQYLPEDQRTVANVQTAAEHFTRWLTTWKP
jgi:hypothetical protein